LPLDAQEETLVAPSNCGSRAIATTLTLLYRRALDVGVGTKNTAITGQWREQLPTCHALVEPLAGIGGHGFGFAVAAGRASNGRF